MQGRKISCNMGRGGVESQELEKQKKEALERQIWAQPRTLKGRKGEIKALFLLLSYPPHPYISECSPSKRLNDSVTSVGKSNLGSIWSLKY